MIKKDFVYGEAQLALYEILKNHTTTNKNTLRFHLEEADNNGNDYAIHRLNSIRVEKENFDAKFNKLPNFSGNQRKEYAQNYPSNESPLFYDLKNYTGFFKSQEKLIEKNLENSIIENKDASNNDSTTLLI